MQLVKYYDIFFIKVLFSFLNYLLLRTKKKEKVAFFYFVRIFNVCRVCPCIQNVCVCTVCLREYLCTFVCVVERYLKEV